MPTVVCRGAQAGASRVLKPPPSGAQRVNVVPGSLFPYMGGGTPEQEASDGPEEEPQSKRLAMGQMYG